MEKLNEIQSVFLGEEADYNRLISNFIEEKIDFIDILYGYSKISKRIIGKGYNRIYILEQNNYIGNRLLWECDALKEIILVDSNDAFAIEKKKTKMMNVRIWDYITVNAKTQIQAGGWYSSYNNKPFSELEMMEYADNVYIKLKKYLTKNKTALEIGCASGITMFRLSTSLKKYIATDMAKESLEKNRIMAKERNIENIIFFQCAAVEIEKLLPLKVDLVIINSVIQYFPGINYLKKVVDQACKLLENDGIIYLGDIMDLDKKQKLHDSLSMYKKNNPEAKTKLDLTEELFLPRKYFYYLQNINPLIESIEISDKIATIENEMSMFRYDVILHINKVRKNVSYRYNDIGKFQYAKNII